MLTEPSASNISLLTTIQGAIAEELNAYEQVTWFATAYLVGIDAFLQTDPTDLIILKIAMSSVTPLAGRLCQLFRLQSFILACSILLACGLLLTSLAPSLQWLLAGRALTGTGSSAASRITGTSR